MKMRLCRGVEPDCPRPASAIGGAMYRVSPPVRVFYQYQYLIRYVIYALYHNLTRADSSISFRQLHSISTFLKLVALVHVSDYHFPLCHLIDALSSEKNNLIANRSTMCQLLEPEHPIVWWRVELYEDYGPLMYVRMSDKYPCTGTV